MPLRPLNDTVIVEPDAEEIADDFSHEVAEAIKSGILVIPEKFQTLVKKVAMRGTVVSCGDKCKYDWKHGDRVIYGRFTGAPLPVKGKNYRIIREYEALAREEND
jgi:co-chaperonin GroES (HSP10)